MANWGIQDHLRTLYSGSRQCFGRHLGMSWIGKVQKLSVAYLFMQSSTMHWHTTPASDFFGIKFKLNPQNQMVWNLHENFFITL